MSAASPAILVVEDHAAMGRALMRFLEERGKMQVWALLETAEAALEWLATRANGQNPDLVLVDVSLPGMSGLDLVAKLTRLYPELPCLMLSAHRNSLYVRQALRNGARGYVTKGDPPVILEAVAQVLDGEVYLSEEMRRAMET